MKTKILYEDEDILVCLKPAGLPTQTANIRQTDLTDEIRNYLKKPYIGLVHRLDQPVEGILVLAKNDCAAAKLSKQVQNGNMKKYYQAVTLLRTGEDIASDTLVDYLKKDSGRNLSRVVNEKQPEAKRAELAYETLLVSETCALRRIELKTGRHHQIRVQFSHAGMPLLGDQKYGNEYSKQLSVDKGVVDVALCAYQLTFLHPVTCKKMEYAITPSAEIFHHF